MTNRWLLPENLADILPTQALQVEELRRVILDLFQSFGYQLVIPPMLEYVESLLTAAGSDMSLQIFKLVDQLSGRTLGIRSDMTTQVARIDAHILNLQDISRLCYAGTTLQTRVVPGIFSREQLQLGLIATVHVKIFQVQPVSEESYRRNTTEKYPEDSKYAHQSSQLGLSCQNEYLMSFQIIDLLI